MKRIERAAVWFRSGSVVAGALAALVLLNTPATSQQPSDGKWLPFLGCWETDVPADAPLRPGAVCMVAQGAGVEAITVSNGEVTARRSIIADGRQRDITESGCTGWERASWSSDGQRVYLRSEMTCEGGVRRVASGVLAMATPTEWVDVQSIESGGYPVVRALHFQPAGADVAVAVGVRDPTDMALALETARTAAAEPLSVADISEASRELSHEALEMLLFTRGGTIEVNAASLLAMADAGVPERVIDLVVALAYPQTFAVNTEARMVGYRPDEPRERSDLDERHGRRVYDSFYYDPFGYRYYGYGSYYSPFSFGGPYGWRQPPVIIVQPPDDAEPAGNPRLVRGRGYTRGVDRGTRSPDAGSTPRIDTGRSSSGSSAASGSSGSSSSGSSSSGRTAKRRGG